MTQDTSSRTWKALAFSFDRKEEGLEGVAAVIPGNGRSLGPARGRASATVPISQSRKQAQ